MEKATELPLNWIKWIPGDLLKLDESPLLGYAPPFPWEAFATQLMKFLQIEGLKLEPSPVVWRSSEDILSGFDDQYKSISGSVVPLEGSFHWVMTNRDIKRLMSLLIAKEKEPIEEIDPPFEDAFFRFLTIEAINAFEKTDFDKKISTTISAQSVIPSSPALGLDISILWQDEHFWGRLLISPELRRSWQQRFLQKQASDAYKASMAEKLQVDVHLEGGKLSLRPSEWKGIHLGDVLLLDACSLDPGEDKGRVMLTVNAIPFFRAKIKQGSIKILEHPLYYEVDTAMNKNTDTESEDHEDEDETSEIEDEDDEVTEDEDLDDDTDSDDEEEEEDDTDLDDLDSELEDEEEIEEEEEETEESSEIEKTESPPPSAKPVKPAKEEPAAVPAGGKQTPAIEEINLPIVVEVGRMRMSVKKLMELQPGNILDLEIHPDNGVDLVVNGRRIAKGELLKIGETLGVRILELF